MKSLFHDYCPHHEPQVVEEGREVAVMLCHDAVPLFQGGLPVGGGEPLVQVVDEQQVAVANGIRLLHQANRPVEVRRKPVG